jgi:nucleotide-binding universal stress UspA family protein
LLEEDMTTPKHIVAATDFSATSDRALEFAADLARTLGAKLSVVHCFEAPYPYPVPLPPEYRQELRTKLESRCTELRSRVPEVVALLREGTPWTEIVAVVGEVGADLLVVGTHGRRGVTHLLLGSVAEKVVRLSPVAVLTVPHRLNRTKTA